MDSRETILSIKRGDTESKIIMESHYGCVLHFNTRLYKMKKM